MSDIPGTTTDPVRKAMEIPGIGPCVFTDTAGFDDDAAGLGEKRTGLTLKALEKTDIALMIFSDCGPVEKEWYRGLVGKGVPTVPVISKADLEPSATGPAAGLEASVAALCGESPVRVSSLTGEGIDGIFRALLRRLPEDFGHRDITGDLVKKGDTVLLVMPQDIQAPKGRLILPQVQTLRNLLDKGCMPVCSTADRLSQTLAALSSPPALMITDSQVFPQAEAACPPQTRLTSFSILFARQKGDIRLFMEGAKALLALRPDARVLIAEACTHVPRNEDIGRVKLPRLLRRRFGEALQIEVVGGNDFPEDLSGYDLVIHCGACMFTRRHVLNRLRRARACGVPVTNYGVALAALGGMLERVEVGL